MVAVGGVLLVDAGGHHDATVVLHPDGHPLDAGDRPAERRCRAVGRPPGGAEVVVDAAVPAEPEHVDARGAAARRDDGAVGEGLERVDLAGAQGGAAGRAEGRVHGAGRGEPVDRRAVGDDEPTVGLERDVEEPRAVEVDAAGAGAPGGVEGARPGEAPDPAEAGGVGERADVGEAVPVDGDGRGDPGDGTTHLHVAVTGEARVGHPGRGEAAHVQRVGVGRPDRDGDEPVVGEVVEGHDPPPVAERGATAAGERGVEVARRGVRGRRRERGEGRGEEHGAGERGRPTGRGLGGRVRRMCAWSVSCVRADRCLSRGPACSGCDATQPRGVRRRARIADAADKSYPSVTAIAGAARLGLRDHFDSCAPASETPPRSSCEQIHPLVRGVRRRDPPLARSAEPGRHRDREPGRTDAPAFAPTQHRLVEPSPVRAAVERAIDPGDYECGPTALRQPTSTA